MSLGSKFIENAFIRVETGMSWLRRCRSVALPALASITIAVMATAMVQGQVNVTTYQNDIGRTGQNLSETILNTSNVNPTLFGKLFSQSVVGQVYAQPLYLSGVVINGVTHNVVYVATEHDQVYAFDADSNTGANASALWTASMLSTTHGAAVGATTVPWPAGSDIAPEVGITGTPVIDPVSGTLYVVSKTVEGGATIQRLHALDVTSGAEKFGGPVAIAASVAGTGTGSVNGVLSFDPAWHNQRPGLLLLNGIVYIGFASHEDSGPWHGWIISYNASTLKQAGVYCASPNGIAGGFWASGAGLAADQVDPVNHPYGRLFAVTGNGDYNATKPYTNNMDYGDSHLNLDLTNGQPTVTDEFTTKQQASLAAQDGDVGSGGVMVLPNQSTGSNPHLLVQADKQGSIFLLNRENMGGYNTTADQVIQELSYAVGNVGVWSSPAYWNGNVYFWGRFDYLKSFALNNGLLSTTPTRSTEQYAFPGATPSISANGNTQGIVWTINSEAFATGGPAILQAHSASNVATTLYSSSTNAARDAAGAAVKFAVPTIANGKVYVGAANEIDIYGLLNGATQTSAPVISPGTESFTGSITVTITDATPGASIYYTTNGTAASTSSTLYTGPITVSNTETINAIAIGTGMLLSAQASATFTSSSVTSPVTFSLPTGTYTTTQSITLSDPSAGAVIYYTVDGSIPTTASTVYSAPISVTSTETITAIAIAPSMVTSTPVAQTYTIQSSQVSVNFGGGFTSASGQINLNGSSRLSGSSLLLTTGLAGQAGSAWFSTPVNIQTFTSDFTFKLTNPSADGMTFTIQNASQSVVAMGGNGYQLGYQGIGNSAAIKFDLYNSSGEGPDSTGLYLNGASPTVPAIDLRTTGINLHSGDVMAVHLTYLGTTLTMKITDTVTLASWSTSWTVNLPTSIGSNTAYVGFTAATGGLTATQAVLSWTFASSAGSTTTATPTFSVAAGTYTSTQSVSITDSTAGATIYYTTDGSTPTTSSTVYSGPISVSTTETINAIAVATGYTTSAVATAAYTINPPAATPTFSLAAGTYTSTQSVSIADSTAGATIYYTTNGSTPTTSSTVYSGPISVSTTETINAIAVATGFSTSAVATAAYTISTATQASTPVITPSGGVYNSAQSVTISDATPGAAIYYTINGTTPTAASTLYKSPITIANSFTLQAIAVASGLSNSAVATATYSLVDATPVLSLAAGTYTGTQTLTITCASPTAGIWYTTNGINPQANPAVATKYTGPITISATETVKVQAIQTGFTASPIVSASYTIQPGTAAPVFSPAAGSYGPAQQVTISDSTAGAVIYYTADGSTPTTSSAVYAGPITVAASQTLQAIAATSASTASSVTVAAYTINGPAAAPGFSLLPGTYTGTQTVSITDSTAGATIYYTTNGSAPTTSSTVYAGPISVSVSETINAIAVASGYSTSAVSSATYTISSQAAAPVISPAGGTYTGAQAVTLTDSTPGATIYFTVDGSTPTTASFFYTAPISVTASETLKAMAVAPGYSNSAIVTAVYTISQLTPAATPTFSVAAGNYSSAQSVALSDATAGATIYYTTNGSVPTTSSAVYSAPINVATSQTINAIAVASGFSTSAVATATYTIGTATPTINYSSGFNATGLSMNNGASLVGSALQLTDGGAGEARTGWFATPVNVQKFTTDFNFQATSAVADGFTFAIQNASKGPYALGGNASYLGYGLIGTSVAVKFDLYSTGGSVAGTTGFYTNGAVPNTPEIDLTGSGVDLHSGNVMHAHVVYDGTTLSLTITDTVTNATFTTSTAINIPAIVGKNTAYVGFTGSTGGLTAIQNVLNWTYTVN